jgi:hypothetical protein
MLKRLMINIRREADRARRKLLAPKGMAELPPEFPQDFSPFTRKLWRDCGPFTMTSKERMAALEQAVRHVHAHGVDGAMVECGVGLGGSMMAVATVLRALGDTGRDLWLFDAEPAEHRDERFGNIGRLGGECRVTVGQRCGAGSFGGHDGGLRGLNIALGRPQGAGRERMKQF